MSRLCRSLLEGLTEALAELAWCLVYFGVKIAAFAISIIFFPIYFTAFLAIKVAKRSEDDERPRLNLLAGEHVGAVVRAMVVANMSSHVHICAYTTGPGKPHIEYPTYEPLGAKSQICWKVEHAPCGT